MQDEHAFSRPVRVAIVAPSMGILGGQAVQAARLLACWSHDPDVRAWLVPVNPVPPVGLRWATRVKYLRTIVTQLLYWPLLLRELRRADVVHVFSASYFSFLLAPLPAVLVAKLLGRPVLLNYRSGEAPDHLRRSRVARAVLARVDRNLVPSRFLLDVFGSFGLTAQVIPNIVDLDRFAFRRRSPFRARLVSTRNFEPLYNVACTLRAFRLVQDEFPDASLALVGGGSLDAELRHLAEALGLRNVAFRGRVDPAHIWASYADADIYVQTPDIDNMPASVLEAAASGAVVVSTDAGGVPAIVTNAVDGLLVPTGSERSVADAVLRILREPGLGERLAAAARERCQQYAWPRVRAQWLAVYRELSNAGVAPIAPEDIQRSRVAGLVARLRSMDRHELAFRTRTVVIRTARRLAARATSPRWNRRRLAAALNDSLPALSPAIASLAAGRWAEAHRALSDHLAQRPSRFALDPTAARRLAAAVNARFPRAADDARARADKLLAGRYDLLGYASLDLARHGAAVDARVGTLPDWHLDPVHRRRSPMAWWDSVDYLDPRHGDHKVIWELNRHQHWLTLGRAYWLTKQPQHRQRFAAELEDWMGANPPLVGINWASMLELSLRSVSWVWAAHFFLGVEGNSNPPAGEPPWLVDLLLGLDRQMRHVEENLSRYFSPNTHLTGEALGLYVVGRAFPELRRAARWQALGREILLSEASRQIVADGGHAERSPHYHRYTLDFYLLALAVARASADRAAEAAFAPIVARLARFAWAIADASGQLPQIGDDDGGQLLPLCGTSPADITPSLSIAAALLPDAVPSDDISEESFWVARAYDAARHTMSRPSADEWDRSVAFAGTGYCVSRTRSGDHTVIDAGPHGFLNGGHAHADALSMTLSLRWHRFLIDPGTGTYTMDPTLRNRFRSTALHNTVLVEGRDQAEPRGPFHWQRTVDARLVNWAANPRFDFFEGEHEAYAPVRHRRIVLALGGELWLVIDRLELPGGPSGDAVRRSACVHWHIDPSWNMRLDGQTLEAVHGDGLRAAVSTTARRLDLFHGDNATGLGWCSPAYGQLVPCATIRFSRTEALPFSIATVIAPLTDAPHLSVREIPVESPARTGCAFAITHGQETHFVLATGGSLVQSSTGQAGSASFAGFETDARMAHVALSRGGDVTRASLVDGTRLRRLVEPGFEVEAAKPVHDLSFTIDGAGEIEIFADGGLPGLHLAVASRSVRTVQVNGERVRVEAAGARLIVGSGERSRSYPSDAPAAALPGRTGED